MAKRSRETSAAGVPGRSSAPSPTSVRCQAGQGPRTGAEGEILLAKDGARFDAPPIQRKHARERGRLEDYSLAEGDVIQDRENYQ